MHQRCSGWLQGACQFDDLILCDLSPRRPCRASNASGSRVKSYPCAIWAYHRFALSTADVEDLLPERGVTVSREAIRLWINQFGRHFATCIKRDRPAEPLTSGPWTRHCPAVAACSDGRVVISIRGEKYWLWRAVDANGDVLDILVQKHRQRKGSQSIFPPSGRPVQRASRGHHG